MCWHSYQATDTKATKEETKDLVSETLAIPVSYLKKHNSILILPENKDAFNFEAIGHKLIQNCV